MLNFLFLAVSQVEANQSSLTSNLSNLGVTALAAIGVVAVLRARKNDTKGRKPAASKKAEPVAAPKAEPAKVVTDAKQNGQQSEPAASEAGTSTRQKTFRKAPEVSVAKKAVAPAKPAEPAIPVAETPVVVSSGRRLPGANMASYLQMAKDVKKG